MILSKFPTTALTNIPVPKILISSNTLPNILPKGFIVFLADVLTIFSVDLSNKELS